MDVRITAFYASFIILSIPQALAPFAKKIIGVVIMCCSSGDEKGVDLTTIVINAEWLTIQITPTLFGCVVLLSRVYNIHFMIWNVFYFRYFQIYQAYTVYKGQHLCSVFPGLERINWLYKRYETSVIGNLTFGWKLHCNSNKGDNFFNIIDTHSSGKADFHLTSARSRFK